MTADQMLIDLFAERAEQRPEAAEVLASVHRCIDAPRQVNATGMATVLGSAAAVAALAVGLSVATSHGHGAPRPLQLGAAAPGVLDSASVAPSGSQTVPAASSTPTARSTPTAAITSAAAPTLLEAPRLGRAPGSRNYSTIAAGWLPGPVTHVDASNQPGFEQRDYTVMVDGVEMDAIIYLEDGPLPGSTEAGSDYSSLTINGHPAREFVAGTATIVAVDLGNGKIAYAGPSVVATTNQVTTARITQIAEHIASSMQFHRHDPIG